MKKLLTQRNVLIAVASFILVWYVVVQQKVSEHMTGAPRVSEADKMAIEVTIVNSIIPPPKGREAPKLSAEAKKQLAFLEQNPITAIDDKFMSNLTEIVKLLAKNNEPLFQQLAKNPDELKKAARSVGNIVVANVIWRYADAYEKLKAAPTQSEFKEQLGGILAEDPLMKNIIDQLGYIKSANQMFPTDIERNQQEFDKLKSDYSKLPPIIQQATAKDYKARVSMYETRLSIMNEQVRVGSFVIGVAGENPIQSNSPIVNQIFDIAYKYYFGEVVSASNIASGAWTALVATFGSLGAIAVVGAIVYFVFLR